MSPLPTPSQRVLTELTTAYLTDAATAARTATPVRRRFVELIALLDAQTTTLAELDRTEAALVGQLGYPRVELPARPSGASTSAADLSTIRRHLEPGPAARRASTQLRRRQRRFAQAAETAGMPALRARERDLATRISATTAALLLVPTTTPSDLMVKVALLIAMSEPGPAEGSAFPGAYLRAILVDLDGIDDPARGRA